MAAPCPRPYPGTYQTLGAPLLTRPRPLTQMRTELWLSQLQRKSARGPSVMAEYRDSLFEVRCCCWHGGPQARGASQRARPSLMLLCWRHANALSYIYIALASASAPCCQLRRRCQVLHGPPACAACAPPCRPPRQTLAPEVQGEIEKDVHRTFPHHPRLSTPEGQRAMLNVLRAYALSDPEIGYTQV